jgi:hypothetical protein
MLHKHIILGVHITNRATRASEVNGLLSKYGCNIKTRLGLHHVTENVCGPNGLMLLEMFGDEATCHALQDELNALTGIEAKSIEFDHPKE